MTLWSDFDHYDAENRGKAMRASNEYLADFTHIDQKLLGMTKVGRSLFQSLLGYKTL